MHPRHLRQAGAAGTGPKGGGPRLRQVNQGAGTGPKGGGSSLRQARLSKPLPPYCRPLHQASAPYLLQARFSKHVFPGERLRVRMWQDGPNKVLFVTEVLDRPERAVAISSAAVEFHQGAAAALTSRL